MNKKTAYYLLSILLIIGSLAVASDFEYGPGDIKVSKWIPSKTVSIGTTQTSASFTIEAYCLSDVVVVTTPAISANVGNLYFLNSAGQEYYRQINSMMIPDTQAETFSIEKEIMIAGPTTIRLKLANPPTVTGNYTIKLGVKGN